MGRFSLCLAVFSACGAESRLQDATSYARAAGAPTENCSLIEDNRLQAECVAFGAKTLEECERLEPGVWHDECVFQVCDHQGLEGDRLRACCRGAGEFERQCVGHGARRSAARVLEGLEFGEENRAVSAVEAAMRRELGPAAPKKAEMLVAEWLADRPGEFSSSTCGNVASEVCAKAYQVRLFRVLPPEDARRACGREVGLARATSLGAPPWRPEMDEVVARAWSEVCHRRQR